MNESTRLASHRDWIGQVISIIIMAKHELLVKGRLPDDDSGKIKHELDMLWDSLWDEATNGLGKMRDAIIESEDESKSLT